MEAGVVFLISAWFSVVGSEMHRLEYIYTALSKAVAVPGVYEFTAMGILDDKQIDYYNSKEKTKIPRQTWMKDHLDANYWDKGTLSRKSKEQWFKVNVEILMTRMNQNNSNLHVLQWRHGCQGEPQPDGKLAFRSGFDQYSYDGGDFLSFDPKNLQWVAPVSQAMPTKHKWDDSQPLNQYTEGYLKRECMDWLNKFMDYGEKDLKSHSAPLVFTRSNTAISSNKLVLHCLATQLYARDVEVNIYRNDDLMTEAKGVTSTGIRPSEFTDDGTMAKAYQMKKSVEIDGSDLSIYSCKVTHRTLDKPIVAIWEASENGLFGIICAIFLVVLIIFAAIVVGVLVRTKKISGLPCLGSPNGSTSSGSTEMGNGHTKDHCAPEEEKLAPGHANGHTNGHTNGHCAPEEEKLAPDHVEV